MATIWEALAAKYALPHYISLFEVRDSTGFDSSRSADAIAISLYASRGREITGFEIKHNRADWLKELRDPSKAEEIGKFCDYFFLVTPDVPTQAKLGEKSGIIAKSEEIPGPWGWMVLKGERLKIVKPPQKITPVAMDRPMLCSLLYATKEKYFSEANKQLEATIDQRMKERHGSLTSNSSYYQGEYEKLEKIVKAFEAATGLNVQYQAENRLPKLGEAVRMLMSANGAMGDYKRQLEYSANGARALLKQLEEAAAEVGKLEKTDLIA